MKSSQKRTEHRRATSNSATASHALLRAKNALGSGRKQHHRNGRDEEDKDRLGQRHIDQQKIGVEDEQERQRYGSKRIVERREPCGLDRLD